jgi:hypothetical protein
VSKKIIIRIAILLVTIIGAVYVIQTIAISNTKKHSPFDQARIDTNGLVIEIDYCQPYKKDRVIFGGIVPYGEVWRTGANEATTFEINQAITFGGESLPAGLYGLFTIPQEDEWTIILNAEPDQWGAFDYESSKDVVRITASTERVEESLEQFSIQLTAQEDGVELTFAWDTTIVRVPISLNDEK